MLKAGQLHSCRPPAGPLEAVNTHLSETRNSANRDDLVKIILPSLLTEVLFKAHPARILWSSCPQQSSGPQSIKYSFFPVSPPFSPPLILSYPHGKQFFTTVKENTFLTLCLPQAIPPSLTEKKNPERVSMSCSLELFTHHLPFKLSQSGPSRPWTLLSLKSTMASYLPAQQTVFIPHCMNLPAMPAMDDY